MILHFHSYFSLRYGLMSPEEIVQRCEAECMSMKIKIPVLLADINTVTGIPNFLRLAKSTKHIIPLVGVEIRNGDHPLYVLISKNQTGYASINGFLSTHLTTKTAFPTNPPALDHVLSIQYYQPKTQKKAQLESVSALAIEADLLGSWRLEQRNSTGSSTPNPIPSKVISTNFIPPTDIPPTPVPAFIAWHTTTYRDDVDFETHCLLRCIAHNCLRTRLPNTATAKPWQHWQGIRDLWVRYKEHPQLLKTGMALIEGCSWQFEWGIQQNKKLFTEDPNEDFRLLRELALEGLRYRYPEYTYRITQRLEKEMQLIYELGFTAYFLINWDICRFARERGFFYVGRGSGANSLVAYCLRITDVDPIDLDLYFERFINPHRSSPPDFDIDFSWQDRDEVTAYILNKYQKQGAALLATYSTFQTNAVVRELGKVYGLPKAEIDALLDKPSYYSAALFEEFAPNRQDIYSQPGIGQGIRNRSLGKKTSPSHGTTAQSTAIAVSHEMPNETRQQHKKILYSELLKHAHRIHNLPNHLSIHVGGVLIPEKHIFYYSALELPPKGFPIVQFSMLEAEDLGLAKFDILSQRGLGHIKDAITYIAANKKEVVDPHQIERFKQDPKIERLIATGHTTGCFYVESPAMRQLLRKLNCKDYLTLVAASSVIRPGVARSGMMRTFIERHVQPEKRKEAHPVLWEIMPDTYGIMVYQEDVIKVAHHFAGLGLAESDVLRRGMSGKFRSREEFLKVQEKFFHCAKEKGHKPELIAEVWHQIESFAGYSFAKGHSASYAVESYQSLFLKAYYPLEFYTAVINNFGGFYRTEFYIHAARKSGATIEAPCINNSEILTRIEGNTLWLGLGLIDGLEEKLAHRIVACRTLDGLFESVVNLKSRLEPGLEQLKLLVQVGALRSLKTPRKSLFWEIHGLYGPKKNKVATPKLFEETPKEYQLPSLEDSWLEIAHDQLQLLGFTLYNPFHLIQGSPFTKEIAPHGIENPHLSPIRSRHFPQLLGKKITLEGYLVTVKPTRTTGGKEMNFGTWLDADGYYFDTVHFPPSIATSPFRGRGIYRIWGTITEDFGVFNLEVSRQQKLPYQSDPRFE